MEHLIREFGAWLKQGFGWLVDVIVFGCLWGISQVSRLLGTHLGGASIVKILVLVLVLLLLLYVFYWVFGRFIGVLRWNAHHGPARETSARFRPASIAVVAEKEVADVRSYDFSTSRYLKRHPAESPAIRPCSTRNTN
jgi:hypothetical protein